MANWSFAFWNFLEFPTLPSNIFNPLLVESTGVKSVDAEPANRECYLYTAFKMLFPSSDSCLRIIKANIILSTFSSLIPTAVVMCILPWPFNYTPWKQRLSFSSPYISTRTLTPCQKEQNTIYRRRLSWVKIEWVQFIQLTPQWAHSQGKGQAWWCRVLVCQQHPKEQVLPSVPHIW